MRHIEAFEQRGLLRSAPRFDANGRQTSNEYTLIAEGEGDILSPRYDNDDKDEGEGDTSDREEGDILSGRRVTPVTPLLK